MHSDSLVEVKYGMMMELFKMLLNISQLYALHGVDLGQLLLLVLENTDLHTALC